MRLDPEAAGTFAVVAHGDAVAGKVSYATLGEIRDGEADFLIDALIERMVLAKTVAAAFPVGDEFLENLVHVGGGEHAEEFEFLHALVGMDVNRAGGAHLDVRDAEFAADAEDDAQQVSAAHARRKPRGTVRLGVTRKRRGGESCGNGGHLVVNARWRD